MTFQLSINLFLRSILFVRYYQPVKFLVNPQLGFVNEAHQHCDPWYDRFLLENLV